MTVVALAFEQRKAMRLMNMAGFDETALALWIPDTWWTPLGSSWG